MSEPGILTGSGGRGVVVPSRGFQVTGKKPAPVKKQPCKKKAPGGGNSGNGHVPWWLNCLGRAGYWGGVGMYGGAWGLDLNAGCLLCLGGAALGCALNPVVFCAPLVDGCADYCVRKCCKRY